MTRSKRDDILISAWRLFESQGYHATGINQIIRESGVPKGSFYHYFPEGKEGLAIEAINAISDAMQSKVRTSCATSEDAVVGITRLIRNVADHLEETDYRHGGPLTTVAIETATTNERINQACKDAYRAMHQAVCEHLLEDGFAEDEAREMSTMIITGLEGGVLLSRTFQSRDPLEHVARQIETVMRERQTTA